MFFVYIMEGNLVKNGYLEANRLEAMVEFDYVAQEPDELTIHKGDIITDIKTQPGGWWEGTLGDKRGMFPDNFVRVLTDPMNENVCPPVSLRTVSGRKCKVLFSYQPANEDELQLEVNDVIDIIGEVEEGWWKGKLRDSVGVFPSNFVTEINEFSGDTSRSQASGTIYNRNSRTIAGDEDAHSALSPDSSIYEGLKSALYCDAPTLPPKPVKETCHVIFPYEAANKDELTLKEGDIIMILSKDCADRGWWKGELRGRIGVFPDNFVEIIQDEVSKKPERPPSKSQLSTTNRIRDTITKPSASSSSKSDLTEVPANRKSQDDKPPFPPVPGKKPQLPPPIKKPQRIGMHPGSLQGENKHQDEPTLTDVDGVGSSRIAQSNYGVPKSSSRDEVPEFDDVERSAMLNHPTAGRVKAPRRRLPTAHSRESDVPIGLMNGSAHTQSLDDDFILKNNGVQSRLRENKNRAPWMEELKMNQAKKHVSGPLKSPSSISTMHNNTPDQSTTHEAIANILTSRHSISGEISIPGISEISSKSVVIGGNKSKKDFGSEQNQAGLTAESSGGTLTKSHSLSSSLLLGSEEISDVNQNHQNLKTSVIKQTSLHSTISSSSNIPPKSEGALSDNTASSSTNHSHGSTIPSNQYLELMDKIMKLEKSLEQQRATFTQAIKEVTEKLNEERSRRTYLEQELDKLTNLVTQVTNHCSINVWTV